MKLRGLRGLILGAAAASLCVGAALGNGLARGAAESWALLLALLLDEQLSLQQCNRHLQQVVPVSSRRQDAVPISSSEHCPYIPPVRSNACTARACTKCTRESQIGGSGQRPCACPAALRQAPIFAHGSVLSCHRSSCSCCMQLLAQRMHDADSNTRFRPGNAPCTPPHVAAWWLMMWVYAHT